MSKLRDAPPIALFILMAYYLVLLALCLVFGRDCRLTSALAYAGTVCALAVFSALTAQPKSRVANGCCLFTLPMSCILGASLMRGLESRYVCMLHLATTIACCTLFFRSNASSGRKRGVGLVSVLMLLPLSLLYLAGFFMPMPERSVLELPSPTGALVARIEIVDEGALGGSTSLVVYRPEEDIRLPFVQLRRPLLRQSGDWTAPEDVNIAWTDEESLIVDDVEWQP